MSGLDVGHEAVRTAAQCSATSWGAISAASSFKIATAEAKKSHWIRMCCSSLSGTCWLVSAVSAQKSGGYSLWNTSTKSRVQLVWPHACVSYPNRFLSGDYGRSALISLSIYMTNKM